MTPQEFTPTIRSLKEFLENTCKIKPEFYKIEMITGKGEGKASRDIYYTLNKPLPIDEGAVFNPLPPEIEMRFDLEYQLNLDIADYPGYVPFLIGQLLFWTRMVAQEMCLSFDVYFDNGKSCNLAIEFKIIERFKGSIKDGFVELDGGEQCCECGCD